MIKKLSILLSKDEKVFLYFLIFFSIIISLLEVIGIGAIMPFMSVAVDFSNIHANHYYSYMYNILNLDSDINFILLFGFSLVVFYCFRSIINIIYAYLMSKFSQNNYKNTTFNLLSTYLKMPYEYFVNKNSSTLTKTILTEASNYSRLLTSLLLIISELVIVVLIYSLMLYVDYKITLVLTLFLCINAFLIIKTISVKIKREGVNRAKHHVLFYEIINKSFGNFKMIKLQTSDTIILEEFNSTSFLFTKSNINAMTLLQVPKLILEAVSFSIMILIVIYLVWSNNDNISNQLSTLSMFILSLYRLMPSVNRIITNYNTILYDLESLKIVYKDLTIEVENLGNDSIIFNKEIKIENIHFEYKKDTNVLNNLSIIIKKGEKIGFIGESGSGKSTLVDIIVGIYKQNIGNILVDNVLLNHTNIKAWRSKIGYIPQSVYLFDGTVGDNIAFGYDFNSEKIIECLKKARIFDFLETKEGYSTFVGEGGVLLSGGQKQRIAIARALYGNPEILVLDEATSALDNNTEAEIMNEIYEIAEDKTLIIIAHRLTTLSKCEKIYKMSNGKISLENNIRSIK